MGEARTASLGHGDVAVRLSRPIGGDLTIARLGTMRFRLYANPQYLSAVAQKDWSFIGYEGFVGKAPQQLLLEELAQNRPFSFVANSLELQQAAAGAGAGIAALPEFMARQDENLVPIHGDGEFMKRDIWLIVHSDLKSGAPVRAVIQELKRSFNGG